MRAWLYPLLFAALAFVGCGGHRYSPSRSQPLTARRTSEINSGVREFMRNVAHDITQEGPTAWARYFEDSPTFFMEVNGRKEFPNIAAARAAIPNIALAIKHIELTWGDDLRVDSITVDHAVVSCSYYEVRFDSSGQRVEESGHFTGTAEFRDGRWQFLNLQWTIPAGS